MIESEFIFLNSQKEYQSLLSSVVILHKDPLGIIRACPVSDVNSLPRRTYSLKSVTNSIQLPIKAASKRECCRINEGGEDLLRIEHVVSSVYPTKGLSKILVLLCCLLLIFEPKKLFAGILGGLLIIAAQIK